MIKKKKIGLVLTLTRRNASPAFCALLPQVLFSFFLSEYTNRMTDCLQGEKVEDGGWNDPAGLHLVPLPFADDIRAAPIEEAIRGASIYLRWHRPVMNCHAVF